MAKPDKRCRQKLLWMHPQALIQFMKSLRWVITDGHLPQDAEFHHVYWDPSRQVWAVVVTSETFPPVLAGHQIPELPQVTFRHFDPSVDGPLPPDKRPPAGSVPVMGETR